MKKALETKIRKSFQEMYMNYSDEEDVNTIKEYIDAEYELSDLMVYSLETLVESELLEEEEKEELENLINKLRDLLEEMLWERIYEIEEIA